jgi:hypothetical protein
MAPGLSVESATRLFQESIEELREEPGFQLSRNRIRFAVDVDGEPDVKVAVGNVPLDYDLWEGLRNPAVVGMYPAGLRDIWEFHANRIKQTVDEAGRQKIFQTPRSFDWARSHYGRALLVSVMLPFCPEVIESHAQVIREKRHGSSHVFSGMYDDVNRIINGATSRVAMGLVVSDTVVVAMNDDTVKDVSAEAIPLTRQGTSHGPCKGGNYPQKSLAVLVGLGQLCVSRIVVRDECQDDELRRFVGPIKSIVMFDMHELVTDGSNGVVYPGESWRQFLFRLFDFTDTDPEINRFRFCTYIPQNDEGCQECIDNCPSGAQARSVPTPEGGYSVQISKQGHRFQEGRLQFDFGRCLDVRSQMARLFPEWSCSRCLSTCAAAGNRRIYAARNYQPRISELAKW